MNLLSLRKLLRVKTCDFVMEASPEREEKSFAPEGKLYSGEAY